MAGDLVETVTTDRGLCPDCAGNVRYDAETRSLICRACRHESGLPAGMGFPMKRIALVAANAGTVQKVSDTAVEIQCGVCRGDLVFEPQNETGICPFCATAFSNLVDPSVPLLLPDAMLPVLISRQEARLRLAERLKHRWFVPDELQSGAGQPDVYGIYLPFWVYACSVQGWYQGHQGTDTVFYYADDDGLQTSVSTTWNSRAGQMAKRIAHVLVAAANAVPQAELSSLERWAFECLQPYNPAFWEGMGIQRTQIGVSEGFALAKEMMVPALQAHIQARIGGDRQRVDQIAAAFQDPMCCHLWLPVWICSGRIKGKSFHLVVNATTGKIEGDIPYSSRKLLIAMGVAAAIITGIAIMMVFAAGG